MNEQKKPQSTPIELTDNELDQANGGAIAGAVQGKHPPVNFMLRVCKASECINNEIILKTRVICKGCPYAR